MLEMKGLAAMLQGLYAEEVRALERISQLF
jgi:hypothetical protein